MSDGKRTSPRTFQDHLSRIAALEEELLRKSQGLVSPGAPMHTPDLFVIGGLKRALALAVGFRRMMEDRNFTCAAALLRMQIDTAARINALSYVEDRDAAVRLILKGEKFDKMKSGDGNRLRDRYIVDRLAEEFPWVKDVYSEASNFVHLSGRHFFTSIATTDEAAQTLHIQISATDPLRADEDYFEVLEAFFQATKMTGLLVLAYLTGTRRIEG